MKINQRKNHRRYNKNLEIITKYVGHTSNSYYLTHKNIGRKTKRSKQYQKAIKEEM